MHLQCKHLQILDRMYICQGQYIQPQLSSMQPLAHSPTSNMGENWKGKSELSVETESLIGKVEVTYASKAKQEIHSPVLICRQAFRHLQQMLEQCSVIQWGLGKISVICLTSPLLPSSHSPLYAGNDIIWPRIFLWSVGVSCPGCAPSQFLVHPEPAHWWGEKQKKPWFSAQQ